MYTKALSICLLGHHGEVNAQIWLVGWHHDMVSTNQSDLRFTTVARGEIGKCTWWWSWRVMTQIEQCWRQSLMIMMKKNDNINAANDDDGDEDDGDNNDDNN